MTRIIAGSARGRQLKVPKAGTRPTSERVREAVFSRLEHLGLVEGCDVADLYSGSGALGLEAASRGASYVECVERSRKAADLIRANARALGLPVEVAATTVTSWLALPPSRSYDLVFLDPPYDLPAESLTRDLTGLGPHLAPGALVVVERARRSGRPDLPAGLELTDERAFGDTSVWTASPVRLET